MTINILWVDDEHNNHFEMLSAKAEYSIVQAMDPYQAKEKLSKTEFNFVLVDILFRYPPWDLPDDIDAVRREIGMEADPVRKGIPLAIWLARKTEYASRVAIFSKLPKIAQEYPQLGDTPIHPKPSGLEDTSTFLSRIAEEVVR